MSTKKIITIFGATGAQGGGLARSILADRDGPFAVRAVTRDVNLRPYRAGLERAEGQVDVVGVVLDEQDGLGRHEKAFCSGSKVK